MSLSISFPDFFRALWGFDPFPWQAELAVRHSVGGVVAGNARRELEARSGTKVSTKTNFKELPEARTLALRKGKRRE